MRPKTTARTLPPRMLMRKRTLVSGKKWVGYYYNGRDAQGKRIEIPLGTDLIEAKRKWAEYECHPTPTEAGLMKVVFDRYERDIIPTKAPKTQHSNLLELKKLRSVFDNAPVSAITPQHVAQYRDARKTLDKNGASRHAPIAANRELALLSHIYNLAREWGYTVKENPVRGVRKNKEKPRDFYADESVWQAVRRCADAILVDAMDLAYLTAQRPADVLKFRQSDIEGDSLVVRQNKTNKYLRIELTTQVGRTQLGLLLDRMLSRAAASLFLLSNENGQNLNKRTLQEKFSLARARAAESANIEGNTALAAKIAQFQFRDSRAKAASEIDSLASASTLLGHTRQEITSRVYRRVGQSVSPTR